MPDGSDKARFWVLFPARGGPTLEGAAEVLSRRGMATSREGEAFTVRWKSGPQLRLAQGQASAAQEALRLTSTELSKAEREAIGRCDACLEVRLDDLAAAQSERVTLSEVQSTLQDVTGGFIFLHWSGALQTPEKTQAG